jgi:DNA-binding transcriptional MerR regulator
VDSLDFLMASPLPQKRAADQTIIPNRLYFKIGDVAKICNLETYVLRFWETEFPQLKPNKSGTGQRLYRRRDVELVLEIKRLVHGEGYTLAGARQALGQIQHGRRRDPQREPQSALQLPAGLALPVGESTVRADRVAATIGQVRAELREIAAQLAAPVTNSPLRRRGRVTTLPRSSDTLFPI